MRPGCCVVVAMGREEGGIVRHQATLHAMRLQRVGGKFYTVGGGLIRNSTEYHMQSAIGFEISVTVTIVDVASEV